VTEFDPTGRVPWVMRVKTRSSSPSKAAVGFVKSASDKVGISSETKSASDKVGKIIMEADPLIRKDLTLNFVMQFPAVIEYLNLQRCFFSSSLKL
jgi:hypothetical protein